MARRDGHFLTLAETKDSRLMKQLLKREQARRRDSIIRKPSAVRSRKQTSSHINGESIQRTPFRLARSPSLSLRFSSLFFPYFAVLFMFLWSQLQLLAVLSLFSHSSGDEVSGEESDSSSGFFILISSAPSGFSVQVIDRCPLRFNVD